METLKQIACAVETVLCRLNITVFVRDMTGLDHYGPEGVSLAIFRHDKDLHTHYLSTGVSDVGEPVWMIGCVDYCNDKDNPDSPRYREEFRAPNPFTVAEKLIDWIVADVTHPLVRSHFAPPAAADPFRDE